MSPNQQRMTGTYSQAKAMLAITRGSLRATFRSPSAVIFSIAFPLIFILVFGFIGGGGKVSVNIAFASHTDTTNPVYQAIKNIAALHVVNKSDAEIKEDLEKGRLTAVINIEKSGLTNPPYKISLQSSEAVSPQNIQVLQSILNSVISGINQRAYPNIPTIAIINNNVQKIPGRIYRTIDFILPGQLGFSLLSSGVFGVAFLFFNLRQQLVLKRFYATPIRRSYIVLRSHQPGIVPDVYGDHYHRSGAFSVQIHAGAWHANLPGDHVAQLRGPDLIHGFWFYCEQCGEERKHHSTLCQPHHFAAIPAGRHFLLHRSFSRLAAASV